MLSVSIRSTYRRLLGESRTQVTDSYSYSTVPLARPSRPSVERPAVARTMDTDTRVGCTYTRVAAQLCTATQTAAYNAWVQQCQAHTHRQRDPAERQ